MASITMPFADRRAGVSDGSSARGTLLAQATGMCGSTGSVASAVNQPSGGLKLVRAPSTGLVAPQAAEPAAIRTKNMASLVITISAACTFAGCWEVHLDPGARAHAGDVEARGRNSRNQHPRRVAVVVERALV